MTSEILNYIFGGGFLALCVGVITLRAKVRQANAEAAQARAQAEKAEAEAEAVRITNTENATRILVENIVKPLKEELNATREDLQATKKEMASTKREMGRLRKALEAARDCPHIDYCPVLFKLRDYQKDELPGEYGEQCGTDARELFAHCPQDCHGAGADESGEDSNIRGQPP